MYMKGLPLGIFQGKISFILSCSVEFVFSGKELQSYCLCLNAHFQEKNVCIFLRKFN